MAKLTKRAIKEFEPYSNEFLENHIKELEQKIMQGTVVLNVGSMFEMIELIKLELARRNEEKE